MNYGKFWVLLSFFLSFCLHISLLAFELPSRSRKVFPVNQQLKVKMLSPAKIAKLEKPKEKRALTKPKLRLPKKDTLASAEEKTETDALEEISEEPVETESAGEGQSGNSWNDELSNYLSLIISKIERNKRYPPLARRNGIEGMVKVKFSIDQNGALLGLAIERGSGFELLDQEALSMVRRASPFPPPEKNFELSLTIVFRLKD